MIRKRYNDTLQNNTGRSVPGAFYRVRTLDGVWGYSNPCMGPEMNPCGKKWLRTFQRAKMSPL